MTFPERLNAWMLSPDLAEVPLQERRSRRLLQAELARNRSLLQDRSLLALEGTGAPEELLWIAERQEELMKRLREQTKTFMKLGEERGLVYELKAVILHQGSLETGHYFAFAKTSAWWCLNDATVSLASFPEMRQLAEGRSEDIESTSEDEADRTHPPCESGNRKELRDLPGMKLVPKSTEARCLVYTRAQKQDEDGLLKQQVPATLQECIDSANQEVLKLAVDQVVNDFAGLVDRLSSGSAENDDDDLLPTARWTCSEAGIEMAWAYLLRACWRKRIPWLPEELCPTADPPDFRMYYGRLCKQLLHQALARASGAARKALPFLVGSSGKDADSDAFLPHEMRSWLAERGL